MIDKFINIYTDSLNPTHVCHITYKDGTKVSFYLTLNVPALNIVTRIKERIEMGEKTIMIHVTKREVQNLSIDNVLHFSVQDLREKDSDDSESEKATA